MSSSKIKHYHIIENRRFFNVSGFTTAHYFFCKPNFVPCFEKYEFSQIFYVLSGTGVYTTEQGSFPIRSGMMFYRPANRRSKYEWTSEQANFALISFYCDSPAMESFEVAPFLLNQEEGATLLDAMKTGEKICEPLTDDENMIGLRLRAGVPEVMQSFVCASLERFLCMVYCRIKGIDMLQDESCKVGTFLRTEQLVEGVKKYFAEHLCEQVTVRDLCEHFWISETALRKKFRRETGMGVMEYFVDKKINDAEHRLGTTTQSVTEIAAGLGFSSTSYFTKVFKAKTGMTPTEYSRYASKRWAFFAQREEKKGRKTKEKD